MKATKWLEMFLLPFVCIGRVVLWVLGCYVAEGVVIGAAFLVWRGITSINTKERFAIFLFACAALALVDIARDWLVHKRHKAE